MGVAVAGQVQGRQAGRPKTVLHAGHKWSKKYYTHNYKIFNKPDLIASPASLNPFFFL